MDSSLESLPNPQVTKKRIGVQAPASLKRSKTAADTEASDYLDVHPDAVRYRAAKNLLAEVGVGVLSNEDILKKLNDAEDVEAKRVVFRVADSMHVGPVTFYRGHRSSATCVSAGASEEVALTGSKDCSVIQWNVETGQKVQSYGRRNDFESGGHFQHVLDIATKKDSHFFLSAGVDRVIRIWDTRISGLKVADTMMGHTNSITGVCLDPVSSDISECYTASSDKSIRMWSLSSRKFMNAFYGHTKGATCMSICTHCRPITGSEDGSVRYWKTQNSSHLIFDGYSAVVDACSAMTNNHFVAGDQEGNISFSSILQKRPLSSLSYAHGRNHSILSLTSISQSDVFMSGSDDDLVRVWKVGKTNKTSKNEKKVKESNYIKQIDEIPVRGCVNSMCLSHSGQHLFAAVGREPRLGRWMVSKGAKDGIVVIPIKIDV